MPKSGKLGPADDNPLQFSYRNYAVQAQNLWQGFAKPALVGECGYEHTYYEAGMPGYLAMYHNALWVGLANGLCATPFWWDHGELLNDSVVNNQMLHFSRFVAEIDFAGATWAPATIGAGDCDAWAMKSDQLIFGWVVNPRTSVANETVALSGLPDGQYGVRLYRTWRGVYLDEQVVECRDGKLSFVIPELNTTRGRAAHIGHDVALKITRR
jgi:hypothetical protein